jgi:hypothetical protein
VPRAGRAKPTDPGSPKLAVVDGREIAEAVADEGRSQGTGTICPPGVGVNGFAFNHSAVVASLHWGFKFHTTFGGGRTQRALNPAPFFNPQRNEATTVAEGEAAVALTFYTFRRRHTSRMEVPALDTSSQPLRGDKSDAGPHRRKCP